MPGKTIKRVRVFAGPNGSGKSTLFKNFPPGINLGVYVNADDIENELRQTGLLNLDDFKINATYKIINSFIAKNKHKKKLKNIAVFQLSDNVIKLDPRCVTSYWAAMIADFIRMQLVLAGKSFSFETVMSDSEKILFLQYVKKKGYRIYLYYISTEDPFININRIDFRVEKNLGHPVPDDRVKERYQRSLDLLLDAVHLSYRSYIFDNTGPKYRICAEKTPRLLRVCGQKEMPVWLYKELLVKNFDLKEPIPLRKLK